MARESLKGGDRLARGAASATFIAGGAKKGDKIQINKGIAASDETRAELERIAREDSKRAPKREKAVIKRTVRPLYDRVVVRTKDTEEISAGGIILSVKEEDKEKPLEGVVVYVGNGKIQADGSIRPLDVKRGDNVLFGMYAGTEVKIDGEKVLMLREEEILAVIE